MLVNFHVSSADCSCDSSVLNFVLLTQISIQILIQYVCLWSLWCFVTLVGWQERHPVCNDLISAVIRYSYGEKEKDFDKNFNINYLGFMFVMSTVLFVLGTWQLSLVVVCWSWSTNSVSSRMGDCLWTSTPSLFVTSRPVQLSLAILLWIGGMSTGDGHGHR